MLKSPLDKRLDALPLILCGPILRRTQPDQVTVWLALRKPRRVRLEVFARDGAGWARRQDGVADTVALGPNLHVVAVTTTNGDDLVWGDLYGYDLAFEPAPGAPADTLALGRLFTAGVVAANEQAARKALTYQHVHASAPDRPSFVLPPDAAKAGGRHPLDHLRICHGSCRKAHGESHDALANLDLILSEALKPGAADPRPHMLLLTGDQIYADDVADALLGMVIDAGATLLGYSETLPGETQMPGPGHRAPLGDRLKLTAMKGKPEYGKSHLLRFSEYAAMYLFAWSDVLWPSVLPELQEVIQGAQTVGDAASFAVERSQLDTFRKSLPQVRRALANVPVYMIFDDHEISDDWYLNLQWTSDILSRKNLGGRRVITNGLLAYAIFQAWGNTPWQFKEGDAAAAGRRLLTAASRWRGKSDADEAEIVARLNIPTYDGVERAGAGDGPPPVMRWHYTVETPGFLGMLLDTRTMRGFPGMLLDPPQLLNEQGFALQIDEAPAPPADGITVVVATTNVFPEPFTEIGIKGVRTRYGFNVEMRAFDPDFGDAWEAQSPTFERLLAKLVDRAPHVSGGTRRTRVVIASGDIHYGYTVRGQYWGDRPYVARGDQLNSDRPVEAVIAQFTASSFRNEALKTIGLSATALLTLKDGKLLSDMLTDSWIGWREPPADGGVVIGWDSAMEGIDALIRQTLLFQTPALLQLKGLSPETRVLEAPDWRYRTDFIKDTSPKKITGVSLTAKPDVKLEDRAKELGGLVLSHLAYADGGAGRVVVGRNNIGELRFRWGAGEDKAAVQKLWWRLTDHAEPAPLTEYVVPMGFNVRKYPKPSYPGEK